MFIVITGGDKCGKTVQCSLLAGRLRQYGAKVFEAKVPDLETSIGRDIKRLLRTMRSDGASEADEQRTLEALFVVDRALTEKKIVQAESDGKIVVCSRWTESAFAYALSCGFDEKWHETMLVGCKRPDLLIMLDIPAAVYEERVNQIRGTPDFLALDSHDRDGDLQHKVRVFLRNLSNVVQVNGARTPDEVAESVWKVVVSKFLSMVAKQ